MNITLKVKRHDPEQGEGTRWQEYAVSIDDSATVLDALIQVREQDDESLSLRCSCRSHICGSCAMRINHKGGLGCKTKLVDVTADGGEVVIEPAGNMPVIKDLVVDFTPFFNKVKAVEPYLQPSDVPPEREYLASHEDMNNVKGAMACIMCGACVSECTVLEVNDGFLGPAALAKAWRFVADPRDNANTHRLEMLSQKDGVWDCTHCFMCVEVCPKGVAPMERIVDMRRRAMEEGFTQNNGTRHSNVFRDSIRDSGWLDETKAAMKSVSGVGELLSYAGVGVRSFLKGKAPLTHKPLPGAEHVRQIFDEVEAKAERFNAPLNDVLAKHEASARQESAAAAEPAPVAPMGAASQADGNDRDQSPSGGDAQ